eukprot:jgi/Tetstr1/465056/TSEL_009784.t1
MRQPSGSGLLEAIVHSMEAIHDGHRFRLAYLRKHRDTQMHHGDTFALDIVRERYLRPGTGSLGSPEFSPSYWSSTRTASTTPTSRASQKPPPASASSAPSGATTTTGSAAAAAAKNSKTERPESEAVAPRATFAKDVTKDSAGHVVTIRRAAPSNPAAAYGAFQRVRRTTKTPTYFTADAEAKPPLSELVRASIKALYGTDDRGVKVLDLRTTSLMASTYSKHKGKIRLFAEFSIDEEGVSPMDCTEYTCVRYLAWIADRGTIGAGSLQLCLSAINTFFCHTGRDDAPATGLAIGDMKRALKLRQLKTSEELRRGPLPCAVITDILDDLASTLSVTTPGYGTILIREGAAVCSTLMFYSRGGFGVSCRLRDPLAVDTNNITLFVDRENGGLRKRRDGFKPLL